MSTPEGRLKVLAIVPGKERPGSMPFVREECAKLAEAGVSVELFYISGGTSVRSFVRDFFRFRKVVSIFKPDILHAHFGTVTGLLVAIGNWTRPFVITFRGSDLQPSRFDGRLRNVGQLACSYLAALRADQIVCVSTRLRARLPFRRKSIAVIPSGIDLQLFSPLDLVEARAQLGWTVAEPVVVFYAGAKLKRLDLAEEVMRVVKTIIPAARLETVTGDLPHARMPTLLCAGDVLLFLSDQEGSPCLIREANACNLPVVSFDVGDVGEQLTGVCPGGVFGRDLTEVADQVVAILRDRRRSNGRTTVATYAHDKLTPLRVELYTRLVRRMD